MKNYIKINEKDNVAVALEELKETEIIPKGHKFALKDIKAGEDIIKYGASIGKATVEIKKGEHVHVHNVKTNLGEKIEYSYEPNLTKIEKEENFFQGYVRKNGDVGIRNEVWIINTVGCINKAAEKIASKLNNEHKETENFHGVHTFVHPYGCSQMGEDHVTTQKILARLVQHPNAAKVLILSLGCENNNIKEFKKVLGDYDTDRVKILVAQEVEDEVVEGVKILSDAIEEVKKQKREKVSVNKLVVGLKCGGSDGLSGITANPLVGKFSDKIIKSGGTSILTEVPEMFGAETILMNRCENETIFNDTVKLINNFKQYYTDHNQVVYENPSPGNKEGGITTLEDKSLGCTQKGGSANVTNVLSYGEKTNVTGLNLLQGPGNDIVACTALAASGAHIVLFTTGRGTPLGGPVPTVKISTNDQLWTNKNNWMDFNAGKLLDGRTMEELSEEFFQYVLDVASGVIKTKNEINDYREIAIFKDGVTL